MDHRPWPKLGAGENAKKPAPISNPHKRCWNTGMLAYPVLASSIRGGAEVIRVYTKVAYCDCQRGRDFGRRREGEGVPVVFYDDLKFASPSDTQESLEEETARLREKYHADLSKEPPRETSVLRGYDSTQLTGDILGEMDMMSPEEMDDAELMAGL